MFEDPLSESYLAAFRAIEADANNRLIVAVMDCEVIGTLQLTFIPSISFRRQAGRRGIGSSG